MNVARAPRRRRSFNEASKMLAHPGRKLSCLGPRFEWEARHGFPLTDAVSKPGSQSRLTLPLYQIPRSNPTLFAT
jgi:hypothetical protein